MSKEVTIAVEAIDAAYGHHTAHLTPWEQMRVALELIRRLSSVTEGIAKDEIILDDDESAF
jgi:hypothetical protein